MSDGDREEKKGDSSALAISPPGSPEYNVITDADLPAFMSPYPESPLHMPGPHPQSQGGEAMSMLSTPASFSSESGSGSMYSAPAINDNEEMSMNNDGKDTSRSAVQKKPSQVNSDDEADKLEYDSPSGSGSEATSELLVEGRNPYQYDTVNTPSTKLTRPRQEMQVKAKDHADSHLDKFPDSTPTSGDASTNEDFASPSFSPLTDFRDDIRAISATFSQNTTRLNAEMSALKHSLNAFSSGPNNAELLLSPMMMNKMIESDDDDDNDDDGATTTTAKLDNKNDTEDTNKASESQVEVESKLKNTDDRKVEDEVMSGSDPQLMQKGHQNNSKDGELQIQEHDGQGNEKPEEHSDVNTLLRDNGFPGIDLHGITNKHVLVTLRDILNQYCRRGKLVRELLDSSELHVKKEVKGESDYRKLRLKYESLQREFEKMKDKEMMRDSDRSVKHSRHQSSGLGSVNTKEIMDMASRCRQMEHDMRVKDKEIDSLRERLHEKIIKEERQNQKDKKAYMKIKSAVNARDKGVMSATALRDLKVMDVVSMYETQRERTEVEISSMRQEINSLSKELREKENYIIRRDLGGGWRTPNEGELAQQIALAKNQLASNAAELNEQRDSAARTLQESERRRSNIEKKADSLAEANANLVLELESRPTKKAFNDALDKIEMLEAKLRTFCFSSDQSDDEAVGDASDIGFQHLTTSDKIKRDKDVLRLGLQNIAGLPRDTLIKVLQDVCIRFEIKDVRNLPIVVMRCLKILASIPQLEKFVSEVCEVVFDHENSVHNDQKNKINSSNNYLQAVSSANPVAIPVLLRDWRMQLHQKQLLADTRDVVIDLLRKRYHRSQSTFDPELSETNVAIAEAINEMIEHESMYFVLKSRLADAESVLISSPDDYFVKIVKHFQTLFCSPTTNSGMENEGTDGIIPTMNHVYNSLAEVQNFTRWLKTLLGLKEEASIHNVAKRLAYIFNATKDSLGQEYQGKDYVHKKNVDSSDDVFIGNHQIGKSES